MSEDRSVLYKIRWEIFIMAASLILSAVVVLAIPHDFSQKIIDEQKEQRKKLEELKEKQLAELTEKESKVSATEP